MTRSQSTLVAPCRSLRLVILSWHFIAHSSWFYTIFSSCTFNYACCMGDIGCSSSLPRPDLLPLLLSPSQSPNGVCGPSVPSTHSLIASSSAMDFDSNNHDSNDDLKVRVSELETQCLRLTRKLSKAKADSQNVAQLVALYEQQSSGSSSLPKSP